MSCVAASGPANELPMDSRTTVRMKTEGYIGRKFGGKWGLKGSQKRSFTIDYVFETKKEDEGRSRERGRKDYRLIEHKENSKGK